MQWLRTPADYHNPVGNELLVRLYFGAHAPLEESLRLLETYRREKERYHLQYENIARSFYPDGPDSRQSTFGFSALRYGQMLNECCLKWCDETEARLRALGEADRGGRS